MTIIPSGIAIAFDYTAYDRQDNLKVAMKVYDVTGAPALVDTVTMDHMADGTYIGKFTGDNGKLYVMQKMVYLDDEFTTPDDNYSPAAETCQCSSYQTEITQILNTQVDLSLGSPVDLVLSVNDDALSVTVED